MASTAIEDPEMIKERYDSETELMEKVEYLADMIRGSNHFVAFTGAGISTSAGIPDFRGPEGKWTREAKGLPPLSGVSVVDAYPTATHMTFVELYNRGVLKYVISQNCDGLHRRSGLPASAISELHGNCWVEICEDCGQQYFRDFKCTRFQRSGGAKNPADHFTGRFCACRGRLLNSTIDFGQSLPQRPLALAQMHSAKATLHLACGSSLRVNPACECPAITKQQGGKLVIVNLQRTPLTDMADMQIYASTDTVMTLLMERLSIPVPPFRLLRRIVIGKTDRSVYARGVDAHDPTLAVGHIRAVDWDGRGPKKIPDNAMGTVTHQFPAADVATQSLQPKLDFIGHYQEPPLDLAVDLSSTAAIDISLYFNPYDGSWCELSRKNVPDGVLQAPPDVAAAKIPDYGQSHQKYCIDMVMKHKGCDRKTAEATIATRVEASKKESLNASGQQRSPTRMSSVRKPFDRLAR
jgi:mono-ADP-ribosyltransferase sirtuin 6